MPSILITSRIIGTVVKEPLNLLKEAGCEVLDNPFLGQNLDEAKMIALAKDKQIDGMIVGDDPVTRRVIESAGGLKVISKNGVGVDRIDLDAATGNRVVVTNTPGANSNAVADLAVGLMICAARQVHIADKLTKEGKWERVIGVELWEKTLGIVGVGWIGKAVARRAKGFSMRLLGYDIVKDEAFARETGLQYVDLERIFTESDFISLHVPATEETKLLINKKTISLMKPTAYLINTARGEVVETKDLYEALTENRLAGAAVDAYEVEPPVGNPLLNLPNVVTTCHIGAFSKEAMIKQCIMSTQNTISVLKGELDKAHIVNRDVLAKLG
jgi:D-3-phosphoglycerate dehydrogenase